MTARRKTKQADEAQAPQPAVPSVAHAELNVRMQRLEHELAELRKLLRAGSAQPLSTGSFDVLPCRVGTEWIALELERIREVVPIARLTALPEAPAWVSGLLNLRGSSIPVLDLHSRLRRVERVPALTELIVIVRSQGRRVGLLVAEALAIRRLDSAAVDPEVGHLPLGPYLIGTIPDGGSGHLLLFDLDTLVQLSDLPEAA